MVPSVRSMLPLNDGETRKMAEMKTEDGKVEKHCLFYDIKSVPGKSFAVTRVILMNL